MASYDDELSFSTASVTQTASTALASDSDRSFLLIQNIGSNDIWFAFGATAVATTGGFKLTSGSTLLLDIKVIKKDLSVICAAGQTSTLAIHAD